MADDEEAGPLSMDMDPAECIVKLAEMGLPQAMLQKMTQLAERGIHPLQVLQVLQEREEAPRQEEQQEPMLESFDIEGIAQYIAEKECKKVVVMCGAGLSTAAGIPDFRTPGTGLYDNLQKYDLPRPEAVFSIDYFRQRPGAFYELAKEMWPGNFTPTPAHYFIKLLSDKGILLRCYSQNIDSLERQAGLPEDKLVAAHGNFDKAHVLKNDFHDEDEPEIEVDIAELKAAIDKGEKGWEQLRQEKGGLVKPKIVFFGEPLPESFMTQHREDLQQCDLLIVIGTSLVVGPFNSLVGLAAPTAPRLLINREPAGLCENLPRGFRFHKKEEKQNWRDVFSEGDCDAGCRALVEKLGWTSDLDALVARDTSAAIARAPWVPAPA